MQKAISIYCNFKLTILNKNIDNYENKLYSFYKITNRCISVLVS